MSKINVAIIGAGNCASSLVQGVYKYANAEDGDKIPGLMHPVLGGYHISDIEFVAAFDVDQNKVGKDLSEAIYAEPNNTFKFWDVPHMDVKVERGMCQGCRLALSTMELQRARSARGVVQCSSCRRILYVV